LVSATRKLKRVSEPDSARNASRSFSADSRRGTASTLHQPSLPLKG
jgi:hypothetical protein